MRGKSAYTRGGALRATERRDSPIVLAKWVRASREMCSRNAGSARANGVFYDDLGGDYYTKLNPDKTKQRALNQLRQMGYEVTLNPLPTQGNLRFRSERSTNSKRWATPSPSTAPPEPDSLPTQGNLRLRGGFWRDLGAVFGVPAHGL